jgi:thiamine-monophosphate kinase
VTARRFVGRGRVRTIDERAFHAWLARTLPAGAGRLLPLGDDAAVVRLPAGTVPVVTTDALVEGTHFLPGSPPGLIGTAATAVSLSDVAAKGATPLAVFLAVIVPRGTEQGWAEALVRAAERAAARFGAHVLGGDTKPGPVPTVVSTVVGAGRPDRLVGRTGARPGDTLVTTGEVGRGGLAARALAAPARGRAAAAAAMLRVVPRVREGIALGPYAHAMLDTSDGLAEGARLLARASRVRVVVDEARLPIVTGARRLPFRARRAAVFYGGDYELLAAIPPSDLAAAQRAVRRVRGRLTPIGSVERGAGAFLSTGSKTMPLPEPGWRPFARPSRSRLSRER